MLSSAVLERLPKWSIAPLKVYVYLCSRNGGQPFPAPISKIAQATGLHARAICSALQLLRKHRLIERQAGRGSHPNQYSIPLPKVAAAAPVAPRRPAASKTVQPEAPRRPLTVMDILPDEVPSGE